MVSNKFEKFILMFSMVAVLVLSTGISSFAAITFDVQAIEAEIASAVAAGDEPYVAAKNAVADAVRAIVAANPDYPGGPEALNAAIIEALVNYNITGLDDTDLLVAANHALGIAVDPAIEAYEGPGAQGRENARNRGGNINRDGTPYGPGGKPQPGSPT
jgi:hypothetical protein